MSPGVSPFSSPLYFVFSYRVFEWRKWFTSVRTGSKRHSHPPIHLEQGPLPTATPKLKFFSKIACQQSGSTESQSWGLCKRQGTQVEARQTSPRLWAAATTTNSVSCSQLPNIYQNHEEKPVRALLIRSKRNTGCSFTPAVPPCTEQDKGQDEICRLLQEGWINT